MTSEDSHSGASIEHDLIDELADEYVSRQQAGEAPLISEYCAKYPELAAEIRDLFPMLSVLERAKSDLLTADTKPTPPPDRVGGYELIREIGRGGMGVIYEARHTAVDRRVALKILPQRLSSDPRSLARFEREARAIAGIHHTNVVPLFEFGRDQEHYFLVMQLIDGVSVDKLIQRLPNESKQVSLQSIAMQLAAESPSCEFDQDASGNERDNNGIRDVPATRATNTSITNRYRQIAGIGNQIASALAYAHKRGIIHRDVKPSNMIYDRHGVAWLTDFGLAKTDDEDLTQTGDFLGTLRYTAPERFRGECDGRSDLYALGLSLYELLALRPAFEASDRLQLVRSIERGSPAKLSSIDPHIPRDLETIVCKAIEHVPDARYESAADMAGDLLNFLSDQPIRARKMPMSEKLRRWRRRNQSLANALALLILLSILTIVGAVAASFREAGLRNQAVDALSIANSSRQALQQTLYFAEMNLAAEAILKSGIPRVSDLLQHWTPREGLPEMRGWEWYFLNALCNRHERIFTPAERVLRFHAVSWSPDGERAALAQDNGDVSVWNVSAGSLAHTLESPHAAVLSLDWSPDGRFLAVGYRQHTLSIWDTETWEVSREYQQPQGEVLGVRWSPNSKHVAFGNGNDLYVAELAGDAMPSRIGEEAEIFSITSIQWSPDGTHLFAGNWWQNRGGLWNLAQGQRVRDIPGWFVRFSDGQPDIALWISSDTTGRLQVWDDKSERPLNTLLGHTASVRCLEWSPDGNLLLSGSDDRSLRIWNAQTFQLQDELLGHPNQVYAATWSPDGKRILSVGEQRAALLWQCDEGTLATLGTLTTRTQCIDWHPHGNSLAVIGRDGAVHIWDLADGAKRHVLTDYPMAAESVRWSPSGMKLATADRPGSVRIWDAEDYTCLRSIQAHDMEAIAVAWSRDEKWLASSGGDKKLFIWDLERNERNHKMQLMHGARCLAWNRGGDVLAAGCDDGSIEIWDQEVGAIVGRFKAHDLPVEDLSWSPDGTSLVSCSTDDLAKVWSMPDGIQQIQLMGHSGPVWNVDWSPSGQRIASSSRDGSVRIWDPITGSQVMALSSIRRSGEFWSVRWSPSGKQIAAGTSTGEVNLWDATRGYAETQAGE
ncbi:MAG: protein kinase [bacterium]|nr:protein kinase [bacterium]